MQALAERVSQAGCALVDAPVSGGVKGATAATLTIMTAAPAKIFARAKPVLDALGDKVFHVGETPGQGAAVKTVNQLLCGVHIAACAEALALAEKAGIDGKVALEDPGRRGGVELDAARPRAAHAGGRSASSPAPSTSS